MPELAQHATAEVPLRRPLGGQSFATPEKRGRYFLILGLLSAMALTVIVLILVWGNSFELGSDKWWRVFSMRISAVLVIVTVTFAQATATVGFQTVANNRIVTPSLMGFETLFVLIQTSLVYFFGSAAIARVPDGARFFLQVLIMVLFAVGLYSFLLSGPASNFHSMLLIGIVIGAGFGALSTFMQRMLEPSEFDVLRARLFANIGTAQTEMLPYAIVATLLSGGALWALSLRLNVLGLGTQVATSLGVDYKTHTRWVLTLVAVLMAVSTSLVGPMTFLGFLTATLAYSLTDTFNHRHIFPIAWLLGVVILGTAYLLLRYVVPVVDGVMIVVELVGGLTFLAVLLKRGRL